jgi:predicted nucleic acid-binding protein
MNIMYLDASAWVKRYFAEIGSDVVVAVFSGSEAIACSRFGLVEVAATISRKGAAERLDRKILDALLNQAQDDFAAFTQVQVTDELLINAETLAFTRGLRAGDAVHLASALSMLGRTGVTSVTMISADNELIVASAAESLLTTNPNLRH